MGDDKFHTLIGYIGHVETTSVGCLMFHHIHGFDSPKEMIENFVLCVYLAMFHQLVNEGKIDRAIADKIQTEKDFLAFIKNDSTVYNELTNSNHEFAFYNWSKLMSNEFDLWDHLEYNGWDPWRKTWHPQKGKFLELESFEAFLEAFGSCEEEDKIDWDKAPKNFIIGTFSIEKNK